MKIDARKQTKQTLYMHDAIINLHIALVWTAAVRFPGINPFLLAFLFLFRQQVRGCEEQTGGLITESQVPSVATVWPANL